MAESYDLVIEVVSQRGTCAAEHKVGDKWAIIRNKTPEGMCISAYNALYPYAMALMFGGSFPWQTESDVSRVACPDGENPVIFELRRLRK